MEDSTGNLADGHGRIYSDWEQRLADFKGKHFTMDDCVMKPQPESKIELLAAGQSERGLQFSAEYTDYSFVMGQGINTPTKFTLVCEALLSTAEKSGRDVGAYVLFMIISDETDEAAQAKWETYREGADLEALSYMGVQGAQDDQADDNATAKEINLPEGAANFNMGTLIGSYATIAAMLDEAAAVPGVKGIMTVFDNFLVGLDKFGTEIQPPMTSRDALQIAGSHKGQSLSQPPCGKQERPASRGPFLCDCLQSL
ncbi:LLM class flavin-dependent oxidoreductase [Antarcticimicrobium sediminis]|uniref:LLM class flavin-dependent oxidoreductase n=2 Tax=Antarcticimicrobium sediminis TaxID=2546227 RepID=A0A4V2Z7W4_9RHOB|nr:LLM class flavin-dependent oxidoreductase [Antarcticimicrobium sediminis]